MATAQRKESVRKAVVERIRELAEANGGRITPNMVVADAKNKNSPLHTEFEWDVRKAAASHWIDRARQIIASVEVVVRTTRVEFKAPAFVRDPSVPSDRQGYVSVDTLRSDEDAAREALITEFERAGSALARARKVAAALDLDADVDRIIRGVASLRERVEQHQTVM